MEHNKKKLFPIFLWTGLLFLLVAAYTLLLRQEDQSMAAADPEEGIHINSLQEVTSISWTGSQELSFIKEGDTWYYTEDRDCPLRQSSITSIADILASVTAQRALGSSEDLSVYGLDSPSAAFSITDAAGTSQKLLVGDPVPGTGDDAPAQSPVSQEYYAALEGENQVYTVGSYLKDTSEKDLYDLIETESLPYVAAADLRRITVTKDGSTRDYTTEDDTFNSLAEAISGLSLQSCASYKASEEELEAWGLTDPVMTLTWTYEKGEETGSVTLAIGSATEDQTSYYTKKDDSKAVNLISADAAARCLDIQF